MILDMFKRILILQSLVEFIIDNQSSLIFQLLVMNFPQSIDVIEALHKVIEMVDIECFELVTEKFV